ncbi:MAG: replication initiator protein A, partial [Actinomycetota bacterium]
TEFPFALLASRASKKMPNVVEFRDGEKEWVVSGDPRYGLPTAGDVELYVVLMELTREQNFPVCVQFSRHNVIQRLGWDPGGQSYDRFLLGLDRLVGVTIRTQNAFWDAKQRGFVRRHAFHILEAYDIADSRQSRPDEPSLFPSWIRWSPELYQNLNAGYIKSLDVSLFLSLKSAVSQALYRYLDAKRYDGKPLYRIGLKKLAWEHLGLSRNYFPSDIKRKLNPAHEELIESGLLGAVEYGLMKDGEEMVIYRFPPKPTKERAAAKQPELPEPVSPLAQGLMDSGVSRITAVELAASQPEECERQLQFLPHRKSRDKGAVLVKSIREGWAEPAGWGEARTTLRTVKAVKTPSSSTPTVKAKPDAKSLVAPGTPATEFDAWWEALSADQRESLTAQAAGGLRRENRMVAELGARCPDSPIYRAALRPILKRIAGLPSGKQVS